MEFTEQDKALLLKIQEADVNLLAFIRGRGWRPLSVDELERFVQNRAQFEADENGVSLEQFQKWLDFEYGDRRCISTTRKGTPCKGYVHPCHDPRSFVEGVTNCCTSHTSHGLTYERKGA